MPAPLSVTIIYNKTNSYGLQEDVAIIERLIKSFSATLGQTIQKPKIIDMREPPSHSDIQFHLEIPVFSAIPWAHTNVMLVNPEQWSYAYDAYVHAFDALLFRDPESAETFRSDLEKKGISAQNIHVLPWCASWTYPAKSLVENHEKGFVCFLGASTSKYEYVKALLPHWRTSDPKLVIYTSRSDFALSLNEMGLPLSVSVVCQDLLPEVRQRFMLHYPGHLIVSQGEAFGYAAANAEVAGAFSIMNALPAFRSQYADSTGIAWLSNDTEASAKVRYSVARPTAAVREELEVAFAAFRAAPLEEIRAARRVAAQGRFAQLEIAAAPLFRQLQACVLSRRPSRGVVHCPPILAVEDCPPISIVTPTYHRKKLIEIAFHNLLSTDYPQNKIEWIVIEDNEKKSQWAGESIINFQIQVPSIRMKYIPIEGHMTIGEKRNLAIEQASHDIILFMDDDDHYPSTSFRRRVAWLTKGTKRGQTGGAKIACCTTLALYDLKTGISAVNVPPYDIPFSQRISEATLTFYKSAWEERKFPQVSIAEGESWIEGREDQVIEIPPQQIIVAFSHGANQSSRRIPPTNQQPSCFWGFPKEFLIFIHGLAGVEIA
jgi:hypothetical protein